MPIEKEDKKFRGLPVSVFKRMLLLKTILGADSLAAVIGMGIARLEGGFGCNSCGAHIGDSPMNPPPVSSSRWEEIQHRHAKGCKWVRTRGHQIKVRKNKS